MVLEGERCEKFEPNLFRPKICKHCMQNKDVHGPGASVEQKDNKPKKKKPSSTPSWVKDTDPDSESEPEDELAPTSWSPAPQEESESESEPKDPKKNVCAVPPFGFFHPRKDNDFDFKDGMDIIQHKLAMSKSPLWPQGHQLTIKFLSGHPKLQERVKPYIQEWFDTGINLSHIYIDSGPADIRIDFVEDQTSWSYVGTEAKLEKNQGLPTLHLGWLSLKTADEEVGRVVLHEFGHALGAIHEHQSPDSEIEWNTEEVYDFFQGPPNFWDKATIDFNIIDKARNSQTQYSQFDLESIMLYWFDPGWLANAPSLDIPQNDELSETDKDFMKSIYPKVDIIEPIEHKDDISLKSISGEDYLNVDGNDVVLGTIDQMFVVEYEAGENAQFDSGSTMTLREPSTGVRIDVEGRQVQARWTGKHPYQLFSIERENGDGEVEEGDIVYLWSNEWKRYLNYSPERDKVLCYEASHAKAAQWLVSFA